LGQTETERLERIALIENEADKIFGQSDKARDWLTKNNEALGVSPLSMLDTETGAAEVRKVLSAIAYGGAV
jgi:putative toxin-antitoxin system antitoxin component (TIGR02293 family)